MIFPWRKCQLVSFDIFYVTVSPLSITKIAEMVMFYIKLTSFNDFPLEEGTNSPMEEPVSRIGQFKQSLDSFYITESP